MQGPTLPSQADHILAREAVEEQAAAEWEYQRKRDKAEARERIEDMVGPREVGREKARLEVFASPSPTNPSPSRGF